MSGSGFTDADEGWAPSSSAQDEPLSGKSLIITYGIFVVGGVAVIAAVSGGVPFPGVLGITLGFLLGVAPGFAGFLLLSRRLRDPVVGRNFLIGQMFWIGVPLMVVVALVELVFFVVVMLALFAPELRHVADQLGDNSNGPVAPEELQDVLQNISKTVPWWKILFAVFWFAYVVAALVEESAKLLIGRRYRQLNDQITPKGIVSCFAAAGLGFAASEHLLYAWTMAAAQPFLGSLFGLFRAALAFPVHVGTAFIMGVQTARMRGNAAAAPKLGRLAVPVLFHGTFDAIPTVMAASGAGGLLMMLLAPALQILLTAALMGVCWKEYASMMEEDAGGILPV